MEKTIRWDPVKSKLLLDDISRGGFSFEDCLVAIEAGRILDVVQKPSINHPSQRVYVLNIEDYAYCVPFVETEDEIFLKIMFPSRKYTVIYLSEVKK